MISLEEAQARLLAMATPLAPELLPLERAFGRYTATDIVALRTQPACDLSAMDGYAFAHAALHGPMRVIGESAAGKGFSGTALLGEAVRIFTGAPLPKNTDTVIMQEDVTRHGDSISISSTLSIPYGHHVRRRGSDFAESDLIFRKGDQLSPARIGLAAMAGYSSLPVSRAPRVAILSTGNELVEPGKPVNCDHIPASNGIMVQALIAELPCSVIKQDILRDDLTEMTVALAQAAQQADIVVTIGGASVGDHDLVKPALEAAGASIDFWKIAMRPGKPLMAGKLQDTVILSLPGNPVSAFVTALLFLKPLIVARAGGKSPLPKPSVATLGLQLPENGLRTDHIRATLANGIVTPVGTNDSAALLNLSTADALIVRKPGAPIAHEGDSIEIVLIA